MIDLQLSDLEFYSILRDRAARHDSVSVVLQGILLTLSGDARELPEFTRKRFPTFTSHNLQHSWRIVSKVADLLTAQAKLNLSSLELFAFITAAAFHDVGMISADDSPDQVRRTHHLRSEQLFRAYAADKFTSISEYAPRLSTSIGFIMRAHCLDWEEMAAAESFKNSETILGQILRTQLLAVLLRIGDLLDLDSERSCNALQRWASAYFCDNTSKGHHDRHKHVTHFYYDKDRIEITVVAHSKEEHSIWTEWLAYLGEDILRCNTFVCRVTLQMYRLPQPFVEIKKATSAVYEIWPLRFELDNKGRIWEIISTAIYTGKLDFARELVQNAIDANLRWIYVNRDSDLATQNPRTWKLRGYQPLVLVLYSEATRVLEVHDNGVGMDRHSLQRFLFKVAEKGYGNIPVERDSPFPSIAKFGIGFVSCLIRANTIVIDTAPRVPHDPADGRGRRVVLRTHGGDAVFEHHACSDRTVVRLQLKDKFSRREVHSYLAERFVYPSVPMLYVDVDAINSLLNIGKELGVEVADPFARIIESRIISRHSKQREDCFQKAVIKRGLRCMRRSALRARSFSSP